MRSACEAFAKLDTLQQLDAIRRAGVDTAASDAVLGYLAGNYPLKYAVIKKRLELSDSYGWQAAA